eukprot:XP_014787013.1 PREDICTED: uncharacterized protein LOC106881224 [Octopus bimaculoides]
MSTQPAKHETVVKDVEICQKRPVVPDGGWGWVVCFAAACTCFIVSGLASSSGIFLIGLRKIFDDHISKLSTVGALVEGLSMMAAPVASILLNYFSHQTVLILAGLIGFTGAILGTFSVSIDMMIVTYGLISGVSLGMSFFTCQIIVGLYFDKKRALAIGITNCGGGMGTMLFSLIVQSLLEFYGLRSTLLLIAGILLNITVLGALCRPLPYTHAGDGNTECKGEFIQVRSSHLRKFNICYGYGLDMRRKSNMCSGYLKLVGQENGSPPPPADKSGINDETIVKKQKIDGGSILKRCSAIIGVELFKNINFVLLTISYTFWASVRAVRRDDHVVCLEFRVGVALVNANFYAHQLQDDIKDLQPPDRRILLSVVKVPREEPKKNSATASAKMHEAYKLFRHVSRVPKQTLVTSINLRVLWKYFTRMV